MIQKTQYNVCFTSFTLCSRKTAFSLVYPILLYYAMSRLSTTNCQVLRHRLVLFIYVSTKFNSKTMDSPANEPRTWQDLGLDKLKIMFGKRISPRRIACVDTKYELFKYLWKECQVKDSDLDKYKLNNRDEISTHDDAFSRYLFQSTNGSFTGFNEYARLRLSDRIDTMPQENHIQPSSDEQFAEKRFQIIDLIRTEIGNKLWEFGRHLRVKQGRLDAIDKEQTEVARKVDKIFEEFEKESYNAITYVNKINTALINTRRKDLARKIYEIMER
ncbi:hypothetical protein HA402_001991 [Bradysia odoriphaga]|nr:hypothetical protein HA402_001991 [Bradysia odoriphaga]